MKKVLLVLAAVVAIVGVYGFARAPSVYNGLVPLNNKISLTVGELNAQYQRRADLVTSVVESVKGETSFERGTLKEVTEARAKATSVQLTPEVLKDPEAMKSYQANQATLAGALGRLLVAAEKYPDLQSNKAFRELRVTLEETENRIKYARQEFNKATQTYNDQRDLFPGNLVAWAVGMPHRQSFAADEGAQKMPQVKFN
jgi:LemA protein